MLDHAGDPGTACAYRVSGPPAHGCEYIQHHCRHYPLLLDPVYRDFYASRGWPAPRWLELGLELDNLVIGQRSSVTFGLHLCRGNQQSPWLGKGS